MWIHEKLIGFHDETTLLILPTLNIGRDEWEWTNEQGEACRHTTGIVSVHLQVTTQVDLAG